MPIVTLRHVVVGAAKADFVKHSIRVSLDLPLTDETLALRSKLAFLAMEKESITVTLESAQLPLFGGDAELQNIVERVADESELPRKVESVTISSGGKSVTLTNNEFEAHVKNLDTELAHVKQKRKVRFIDQAQLKRERKPRRMNEHPKNKKRA